MNNAIVRKQIAYVQYDSKRTHWVIATELYACREYAKLCYCFATILRALHACSCKPHTSCTQNFHKVFYDLHEKPYHMHYPLKVAKQPSITNECFIHSVYT